MRFLATAIGVAVFLVGVCYGQTSGTGTAQQIGPFTYLFTTNCRRQRRALLLATVAWLGTAAPCCAQNYVYGLVYDAQINSATRTFDLWYPSSSSMTDPTLPIVVHIHGGAWAGGNDYRTGTGVCSATELLGRACALAALGYAEYSLNYTLASTNPATKWPAQWQDISCFFSYLAQHAGVTVPGNPQKIYLYGESAGGHLAGVAGLAPNNAFPSNCSNTSTNYTIKAIDMESPPIDLAQLYATDSNTGLPSNIANLLGCAPEASNPTCLALAVSASPDTYVSLSEPAVLVQSGYSDASIPFSTQGALQVAFAALNPPIQTSDGPPQIIFPPPYGHDLDSFYANPCSLRNEPSPCGSAGKAYSNMIALFASAP